MSDIAKDDLSFLRPAAARLAQAAANPRLVAMGSILALAGLGWVYLGLAHASRGDAFAVICRAETFTRDLADGPLVVGIWSAMALAMMLPSAAPMILAYAEIADTAARKRIEVVSPLVLAGGYLAVWLCFAIAATVVQLALGRAALALPSGWLGPETSAGLFVGAGLYQFSSLKQACLRQCRGPFSFFFLNWKTTTRGVFQLGIKQGLYCLGCCWAAMLLMFAAGTMNVVWMAGLAAAMTVEKLVNSPRLSYAFGVILICIGVGFVWGGGI
jgi:predicted metal-binding membrane protein